MQKTLHFFFIIIVLFSFYACSVTNETGENELQYAKWLTMEERGDFTVATILNPWKNGTILHRYILVNKGKNAPDSLEGTIIHVPLKRAIIATSLHTHLAYRIGALDDVLGVMDSAYIVSPEIKARLKNLENFGSGTNPDIEAIAASGSDALFVSPFENGTYGALENLNIPFIECADYMESTPLGRAEWMRFYGRLFDKKETADSLFYKEEEDYKALCQQISNLSKHGSSSPDSASYKIPSVLVDTQQGAAWYVPGGNSYVGKIIEDAGCRYLFADENSEGSVPLDFEQVYLKAHNADIWLLRSSNDMTYSMLQHDNPRYAAFLPFKEKHVWSCNTLTTPYYDILPFAPSLLLKEIISIAHPKILPDYHPTYFLPLK